MVNIIKSARGLGVCALLLASLLIAGCEGGPQNSSPTPSSTESTQNAPASDVPANKLIKETTPKEQSNPKGEVAVKVYFPDENGLKLLPETRQVSGDDPYMGAVESLLTGTKQKGEVAIIPKETRLRSLHVKDGVATVDFSDDIVKKFTGGSTGEELMVGSIVDTLTEFPEIKSVRFLIEGKKVDSIAGHMDLSEPLTRMKDLLQ